MDTLPLEMTVGLGFPLEMGIPWEWDKHRANCVNGNRNRKTPGWEWGSFPFPWDIIPLIPALLENSMVLI